MIAILNQAVREQNFGDCTVYCFRILFGLPMELQIRLSCFMMRRYLSIFERRFPHIRWPAEILNDIEANNFDYEIPDEPENTDFADSSFVLCFYALTNAHSYRESQAIITTSCVCAIEAAIHARMDNVWIADDPKSVERVKKEEYPVPTVSQNVAAIAVAVREWNEVINWLNREEVRNYQDEADENKMEKILEYWADGEMTLIVPSTRKLLEKNERWRRISIMDIL